MKRHGCNKSIMYEELESIPLPPPRKRFVPISHKDLYDRTAHNLSMLNYEIKNPTFLVDHTQQKFIATFSVTNDRLEDHDQYEFLIGLLSSNDGSMADKLFTGLSTFMCGNGQWDGEIIISRKHTRNAWDDINKGLRDFVFNLADIQKKTFASQEKLREYDFSSKAEAHDFIVETCKRDILPWQHAPKVLDYWDNPEHDEFKDRDGYAMYNSYTSHWRNTNQFTLANKTTRLRSFIDEFKQPEHVGSTEHGSEESSGSNRLSQW